MATKKNFTAEGDNITDQLFGSRKKPAPEQVAVTQERKEEPKNPPAPVAQKEDESYKMFTTKMRANLHRTLRKAAVEEDTSILQVLDNALTEYFNKKGYL